MDDASLDDFLDAGSDATEDESAAAGGDDATADEAADAATDADAGAVSDADVGRDGDDEDHDDVAEVAGGDGGVEPARSTMTFSPAAGECADCGERVARRWTDETGLVCGACKEW